MTLYLGWVDDTVDADLEGPWADLFVLRTGLVLIDSDHSRSEVYHALKWSVAEGVAVLVAPLAADPKFKAMAPGAQAWLRDRR